ncbi:MAG: hypothetical protein KIS84_13410 [Dokdonella sp.]|nr:hypothetical protein [Dokdonella sp.]
MADVPANIHEQSLSRLSLTGSHAAEHSQQYNKILDLNYVQERNMVSLVEALGVREVTSQSGHLGIPNAGQSGGPS